MAFQKWRRVTVASVLMPILPVALLALGVGAIVSDGFAGAATSQSAAAAIANNSGSVYATDVPGCFTGAEGGPYGDIQITFGNFPAGQYTFDLTISGPPAAGPTTTLLYQFNNSNIWNLPSLPIGTYYLSATWTGGSVTLSNPTVTVPNLCHWLQFSATSVPTYHRPLPNRRHGSNAKRSRLLAGYGQWSGNGSW